jgi:hypothetical protein
MFTLLKGVALFFAFIVAALVVIDGTLLANLARRTREEGGP